MEFDSLEQRQIFHLENTMPPFVPLLDDVISVRSQEHFYTFLTRVYHTLLEHPRLLFPNLHDDDAHTNRFNKNADAKPELTNQIRLIIRKLESLQDTIMVIGQKGQDMAGGLSVSHETRLPRSHLAVLEQAGLTRIRRKEQDWFTYPLLDELLPAWKWLAARPGITRVEFSRCMFNPRHSYAKDVYAKLLGDQQAFEQLAADLEAKGYIRIENRNQELALDYVLPVGAKPGPVKDAWAERFHLGVSMKVDPFVRKPAYIAMRMPQARTVLSQFDHMNESLREFVIHWNAPCSGCRYCVQTDKTGTRPLAFIPVDFDREHHLCPYFPGYHYCWDRLEQTVAEGITACLTFMEHTLEVTIQQETAGG